MANPKATRTMEQRVADLEAVVEIMRLEAEYARSWDTGQGARWADVFTEDGVFEVEPRGDRPGRRVAGRDALRRHCETYNTTATGVHLMHLPHVIVDGETARGGLYFEYQRLSRDNGVEMQGGRTMGYYDVIYVLTEAGWRMKERRERPISRTVQSAYGV